MPARAWLGRVGWPLLDQGIASLGTFLLTIILARTLPPAEYGLFAMMLGAMLLLHMVTSSLLYYPLSIRTDRDDAGERGRTLGTVLVLLAALCVPAVLAFCLAGWLLGRPELILPAAAYFVAWQVQEALRRGLFAELRFAAALPGEIVSYLGQVPLLLLLARWGELTLAGAFCAMALTSALAALVQAFSSSLARPRLGAALREDVRAFWRLGSWSLANNLLAILRVQALFWIMAAQGSVALPALFQAAFNVINLLNPVVLGLCNVIPQMAARAHPRGKAEAWRAAQPFALAGLPVAGLFLSVIVVAPTPILGLIYGAASPYLELATPVRLLAAAAATAYLTDMVCSYFHGVDAPRQALVVNAGGAAASVATAFPLIAWYGLEGACVAVCVGGALRLLVAQILLGRLLADDAAVASTPTRRT